MKTDNLSISAVYASAFFNVVRAEDCLEKVESELYTLRELLKTNDKLKSFLKDSSVTKKGKKNALIEIFGGKISSLVVNQLNLIIDQGRERVILDIIEEFFLLSSSAAGKVYADVVTAIPLSEEMNTTVKKRLTEIVRKEVVVKPSVDESIGGGMVVRIGDKVIDASLRKRLGELRKSIVGSY